MLRHGQSIWNLENRFTGWTDVALTETGRQEARECGAQIYCVSLTFAYKDGKFAQVLLPNCEIVSQAQALNRPIVAGTV